MDKDVTYNAAMNEYDWYINGERMGLPQHNCWQNKRPMSIAMTLFLAVVLSVLPIFSLRRLPISWQPSRNWNALK